MSRFPTPVAPWLSFPRTQYVTNVSHVPQCGLLGARLPHTLTHATQLDSRKPNTRKITNKQDADDTDDNQLEGGETPLAKVRSQTMCKTQTQYEHTNAQGQ